MIRRWRRRRSLVCRQAFALMSDYVDGRLDRDDRSRLEEHLAECPMCVEYLAQLRATMAALNRAEPEALPDEAIGELVELYRRWQAG